VGSCPLALLWTERQMGKCAPACTHIMVKTRQLATWAMLCMTTASLTCAEPHLHNTMRTGGAGIFSRVWAMSLICVASAASCALTKSSGGCTVAAAGCCAAASASARSPRASTNDTAGAAAVAAPAALARGCEALCAGDCRLAARWEVTDRVRGCCGVLCSRPGPSC
jgi:hypothetical protein